jgi:putative ABC transport system permease protein
VEGDPFKALDEPNEAIISGSLARKYFGREAVIGEVLQYDTLEYKIAAVMEDHPANTDLPFTLMLSMSTIKKDRDMAGWGSIWSDEQWRRSVMYRHACRPSWPNTSAKRIIVARCFSFNH